MREVTRSNTILLQYNYEFGFCRNYLGTTVFDIVFLIISLVVNRQVCLMPQAAIYVLTGILLISILLALYSLKFRAKAYAHSLFAAFLSL